MTFTFNEGDLASRMRRWEPVHFGPKYGTPDLDPWIELEKSDPVKAIKNRLSHTKIATRAATQTATKAAKSSKSIFTSVGKFVKIIT